MRYTWSTYLTNIIILVEPACRSRLSCHIFHEITIYLALAALVTSTTKVFVLVPPMAYYIPFEPPPIKTCYVNGKPDNKENIQNRYVAHLVMLIMLMRVSMRMR